MDKPYVPSLEEVIRLDPTYERIIAVMQQGKTKFRITPTYNDNFDGFKKYFAPNWEIKRITHTEQFEGETFQWEFSVAQEI